jgi:hypothetical protein
MLDMEGKKVWQALRVWDWDLRRAGFSSSECERGLVPTEDGLVVMSRGGYVPLTLAEVRNLRAGRLGVVGLIELEYAVADLWVSVTYLTESVASARMFVELVTTIKTAAEADSKRFRRGTG